MTGVLIIMIICGILVCDCVCNKACKIDEYLNINKCPCDKRLFGKLASVCEDEISNTSETSLDDKKVTKEKK